MKLFFRKFGSGKPLLILHGLFGISDNWLSIAKELAAANEVYTLDLRNHGRSPHTENFSYSDMVEDIYEFITDLNLRKISILGHSMGGKVAMNFALEYPHRLDHLIIVDIAPREYPVFHQTIIQGLLNIPVNRIQSRKEADRILSDYVKNIRIRQFLLKNLYRQDDGAFRWRINLPVIADRLPDIGQGLSKQGKIDTPALFIRGEESDYITESDIPNIKIIFPQSQVLTIPGASHWVHSEYPEKVIELVIEFLRK